MPPGVATRTSTWTNNCNMPAIMSPRVKPARNGAGPEAGDMLVEPLLAERAGGAIPFSPFHSSLRVPASSDGDGGSQQIINIALSLFHVRPARPVPELRRARRYRGGGVHGLGSRGIRRHPLRGAGTNRTRHRPGKGGALDGGRLGQRQPAASFRRTSCLHRASSGAGPVQKLRPVVYIQQTRAGATECYGRRHRRRAFAPFAPHAHGICLPVPPGNLPLSRRYCEQRCSSGMELLQAQK
jgi:hypothetical protein